MVMTLCGTGGKLISGRILTNTLSMPCFSPPSVVAMCEIRPVTLEQVY